MTNIVTGRQLRAARILAGLSQKQLAVEVGVHERSVRYWEAKENKSPTSSPFLLERAEEVWVVTECGYFRCRVPACDLLPELAAHRLFP